MAIKPTIYKMKISLSDFNRDYYGSLNLTLAKHPSETMERMMVRVLAFCLNAEEELSFTKGLSSIDEPDIWLKTIDGQISCWIEVVEPSVERIKKSTRLADKVKVYCFNSKSDVWWKQSQDKINLLAAFVFEFEWESVQRLSRFVTRTMDLSISISEDSLYVVTEQGECELTLKALKE